MAKKAKRLDLRNGVQPINEEPLIMSRRLDFADWLQRRGYAERAHWIRENCGTCDLESSIETLHLITESAVSLCSDHAFYDHLDMRWKHVRPEWWPLGYGEQKNGVQCQPVFGRVVIHANMQKPGSAFEGTWLRRAHEEGWLELVRVEPEDDCALESLLNIPEQQRDLPFLLSTSRTCCERAPNTQMEALLRFPGLRGIVFHTSELALPSVSRFSDATTKLQYLFLWGLRSNSKQFALEQLVNLPFLRSLSVNRAHPDDRSIAYILKAEQLQSLSIESTRLTDSGLMRISEMKKLRFLSLDATKSRGRASLSFANSGQT